MKIILTLLLALTLSSCASLDLQKLFGRGQTDEMDELAQRDPVAAAALRLRQNRSPAALTADSDAVDVDQVRLTMARSRQDIATGMSMADVRSLWGDPREVEKAGEAGSGNERWTYYEGLSSPWSLSTARRVYFEGGRVAGWETLKP